MNSENCVFFQVLRLLFSCEISLFFFLLAWGKASLISTKSSGHPKDFFQDFEVGNVAEKDICPPEI